MQLCISWNLKHVSRRCEWLHLLIWFGFSKSLHPLCAHPLGGLVPSHLKLALMGKGWPPLWELFCLPNGLGFVLFSPSVLVLLTFTFPCFPVLPAFDPFIFLFYETNTYISTVVLRGSYKIHNGHNSLLKARMRTQVWIASIVSSHLKVRARQHALVSSGLGGQEAEARGSLDPTQCSWIWDL